jgi:outer membrane biosynthesis protein TonB
MARIDTTKGTPGWWTEKHTSNWEHVKAAFERDWEQTKADFSKGSGENLNQNVGDTVKQSVGSEPIPPLDVKTRPTDPKVAVKEAEKAHEKMAKESVKAAETASKAREDIAKERSKRDEKVASVQKDLANETAKASDKIASARDTAAAGIATEHGKVDAADAKRNEAASKWRDAEQELRYGYSVRSQYPNNSVWNETLEAKLRGEWEGLHTGHSWDASQREIHRGWDYAGKTV